MNIRDHNKIIDVVEARVGVYAMGPQWKSFTSKILARWQQTYQLLNSSLELRLRKNNPR